MAEKDQQQNSGKTENGSAEAGAEANDKGQLTSVSSGDKQPKAKTFEELLAEFAADDEPDEDDTPKSRKARASDEEDTEDDEDDEEAQPKSRRKRLQAGAKKLRERERTPETDPEVEEVLLEKRRTEFVKSLRRAGGDDLEDLDDDFLLDIGIGRLAREGSLERAFVNRKKNPARWREASKVLAADVVERLGKLRRPAKAGGDEEDDGEQRQGSNSRAATQQAARAAARATETRKPPDSARQEEDQKVMNMTPSERVRYWTQVKGIPRSVLGL